MTNTQRLENNDCLEDKLYEMAGKYRIYIPLNKIL